MSYRRILAVMTGGGGDAGCLGTALALALPMGGHVDALAVRPDPRESVPMLGEGISAGVVGEIMNAAAAEGDRRIGAARAIFDVLVAARGLPVLDRGPGPGGASLGWIERSGHLGDEVVPEARLSDLVAFARSAACGTGPAALAFEEALLCGGRPLLLTPDAPPAGIGRVVAVAWNGTAEASRAVAAALPLLTAAGRVVVLTVETSRTEIARAGDLQDHLAWHGIRALWEVVRHRDGETVGGSLLRTCAGQDADLLVMGGYGHSRVREMILGGVTRHVLNHAALPVLMAH